MVRLVEFTLESGGPIFINPELVDCVMLAPIRPPDRPCSLIVSSTARWFVTETLDEVVVKLQGGTKPEPKSEQIKQLTAENLALNEKLDKMWEAGHYRLSFDPGKKSTEG